MWGGGLGRGRIIPQNARVVHLLEILTELTTGLTKNNNWQQRQVNLFKSQNHPSFISSFSKMSREIVNAII